MADIPPHMLLEREILEGNLEGVRKALADGASPNGQTEAVKKPIHYAAEVGSIQVIEALCEKGVDLDVPNADDNGQTALHIATVADNKNIVGFLIEKGVNLQVTDANNEDAMQIATRTASKQILQLLKQGGYPLDYVADDGSTLLHLAAKYGNLEAVKWLVRNGADTGALDRQGLAAAAAAEREGQTHVVEWFASQRSLKKAKLPKACDFIEELRKLNQEGKDLNALYTEGYGQGFCPLHLAAEAGYETVVDYLIHEQADVNVKCSNGMTALHLASWGGHAKVVEKLIYAGCDATALDEEGNAAFHLASIGGHIHTLQLLYPLTDPEVPTPDGKTALHLAAEHGNLKAVRWLLGKGLDPNKVDHSDCTPDAYARQEKNTKIHEYLLHWKQYMKEKSTIQRYQTENQNLRRTQFQMREEIQTLENEVKVMEIEMEKLKKENQVLSALLKSKGGTEAEATQEQEG
ncbi:putative ankyrin repeat protein RF_0381 isoform X2 [Penaeus chinensis]|uniref:putative ankyrin repeat protein RF_0381 isoform X2 n=1 Tax=Penaeus chinensis TaxID=139456 RepID=UPI001FB6E8CB|nr:putative ankyrin repeat protein RF_0381 isoform X2 [Penaeus chinensis]